MRAIDRVLSILECVALYEDAATPSAVAERLQLSLSTTARLMRELAASGLLERSEPNGGYRLGLRLLLMTAGHHRITRLAELADPILKALRDTTGETVSLHIPSGQERVCIGVAESRNPLRRVVAVGMTMPLHYGAVGRVLLAGRPPSERHRYLASLSLPKEELDVLQREVEHSDTARSALATQSWMAGLAGVAAAVRPNGKNLAAISVSGPSSRLSQSVLESFLGEAEKASREVEELIESSQLYRTEER